MELRNCASCRRFTIAGHEKGRVNTVKADMIRRLDRSVSVPVFVTWRSSYHIDIYLFKYVLLFLLVFVFYFFIFVAGWNN